MITTRLHPADVISHDEHDVRLFRLRLSDTADSNQADYRSATTGRVCIQRWM
jgi:hypothetical protein